MIVSFKDKETAKIYNQEFSKVLPVNIQEVALRKLIMIDKAKDINDLRIPPSNHLEKLKGKLDNKYSIRINDKYRICFLYIDENFYDLEIVDYH